MLITIGWNFAKVIFIATGGPIVTCPSNMKEARPERGATMASAKERRTKNQL
jgi:hypothetical protein